MASVFAFPKVRLHAQPALLRAAVRELPEGKTSGLPTEARLAEFRVRLRADPAAQVASSMTARQHRWLVHLASEGDPELAGRIVAVAESLIESGRPSELPGLLPWIPNSRALMEALAPVVRRRWGTPFIPAWLQGSRAGPGALLQPSLAAPLVDPLRGRRTGWPDVVDASRLPSGSPLAAAVLEAAINSEDEVWAHSQRGEAIANWARGDSLARDLAIAALVRVLTAKLGALTPYGRVRALQTGSLGALLDSLEARLGGPLWRVPRVWADIPEAIKVLARLRRSIQIVLINFEPRRRDFWMPWLTEAADVLPIQTGKPFGSQSESGAADAVLITLRGRCFLEFSTTGNACYAYSAADWAHVRGLQWRPSVDSLKLRTYTRGPHWLTHQGSWESKFRTYIDRLPRDE